MKIFNWINIRLVLIFGAVIFLFAFSSKRNSERKLRKSEVIFTNNDNIFVRNEMVNKLLIENKRDVSSIQKVGLDLNELEKNIDEHPMIEKSEVFVSIDGVLKAVVKQKTPIARVFNSEGSFYIDYYGKEMPLSDNFTARVPLVSGDINPQYEKGLNKLLQYIFEDDFLKKNIIGIQVTPNGSLLMMNRNFDYDIDFGRTINIEKKFSNYKAFYQKAVLDSSLYHYKRVNLRFTQQVVCTK